MSNNLHKLITEKNCLELTLNKLQKHKAQTKILEHYNKYLDANHLSLKETEQFFQLFSKFIKEKKRMLQQIKLTKVEKYYHSEFF